MNSAPDATQKIKNPLNLFINVEQLPVYFLYQSRRADGKQRGGVGEGNTGREHGEPPLDIFLSSRFFLLLPLGESVEKC